MFLIAAKSNALIEMSAAATVDSYNGDALVRRRSSHGGRKNTAPVLANFPSFPYFPQILSGTHPISGREQ